MKMNHDIRQRIGKARSIPEMEDAVAEIKSRLLKYHEGDEPWENPEELKEFVLNGASATDIKREAIRGGMVTLRRRFWPAHMVSHGRVHGAQTELYCRAVLQS